MAKDMLTLALEGEVNLKEFATAINSLNSLLSQLSIEIVGGAKIEWAVEELYVGSATATFKGIYSEPMVVENVVEAYEQIGEALSSGGNIPFSETVKKHTSDITNILDGKVVGLRFETQSKEFLISGKIQGGKTTPIKYSYGTVRGVVETLSKHRNLNFTLWDSLFEKPVHCYLKEGEEEKMRNVWGKKAIVSGRVGRQPQTGRIVVIREVNTVRLIEDVEPGSYRNARGVLHWEKGEESAEESIRRLRNAN